MTTEEKYKEIVESRNVAKGADETSSGVKVDPPAEKQEQKAAEEPAKQQAGEQQPENPGAPEEKQKPSKEQQMQHEMAAMRFENKTLRKEIEELKKQFGQNAKPEPPKAKQRSDFNTDEEYGKYVRDTMKDEVKSELQQEQQDRERSEKEKAEFAEKLTGSLERLQKGLAEKVFKDLADPASPMHGIVTDERAGEINKILRKSERMADMLALMQAKPQIFQSMLALPAEKQRYRMYQLEDEIDSMYAKAGAKQQADKEKQERAASLPAPGSFGTHGTGTSDISGLSTEERVNRYKAELRKKNR